MNKRMSGFVLFAVYIALSATGMLLLKMGADGTRVTLGGGVFSVTLTWKMLLGFVVYVLSFLMFTVVLSKFDLSTAYPIASALIMVLSAVLGALVLRETLTLRTIIGIAIIIIGVLVLTIHK